MCVYEGFNEGNNYQNVCSKISVEFFMAFIDTELLPLAFHFPYQKENLWN